MIHVVGYRDDNVTASRINYVYSGRKIAHWAMAYPAFRIEISTYWNHANSDREIRLQWQLRAATSHVNLVLPTLELPFLSTRVPDAQVAARQRE